jgi:hypothetical protein
MGMPQRMSPQVARSVLGGLEVQQVRETHFQACEFQQKTQLNSSLLTVTPIC